MLPDPAQFSFARLLEQHFDTIRAEASALGDSDWYEWSERYAYTGGVRVFPLLMRHQPPGLLVDYEHTRRRCPRTWELVSGQPRLFSAVFSVMDPGACVLPHRDPEEPASLRCHLALQVAPGRVGMRVGEDQFAWQEGRTVVFRADIEHEAVNESAGRRVLLVVDSELTAAERAGLESARNRS